MKPIACRPAPCSTPHSTAAAITPPTEVYTIASFPAASAAAGSSNAYNAQVGGGVSDHQALVALGLVAGP